MKNIKIFVLSFITLLVLGCSAYVYNNIRYKVPFEMEDIGYKKAIIKESHNPFYRLERLRAIVGEEELTRFIKENKNNPEIYTPSPENILSGKYRATLHMHTIFSDGISDVKNFLDRAQHYAEQNIKDGGYMYIAFTDHNTVLGDKAVIKELQKNYKKYDRVKIIIGIEIFSKLYNGIEKKYPMEIHTLVWCINPYDKFLNKEFYKKDLKDIWNNHGPERDFEKLVSMMSEYGIPGIAHPARYTDYLGQRKYEHIIDLFTRYKANSKKPLFTEGYYQSYDKSYYDQKSDHFKYNKYINEKAVEFDIIRTGSTDSHGYSIFKK